MQQKVILTGDRPTGRLHLGHYVGSLENRVSLQDLCKQYIMIADLQALTDNFTEPKKVIDNIYQVALDYLAVGIDPAKNTIFLQSCVTELAELTIYFMNLVNLGRLQRNPTIKAELQQKNFDKEIPVGFLCYPISQASDIAAFKADLVPVGNDQLPILEQANEIIRKFNRIYNSQVLKEIEPYLSSTPRLVGIDGKMKASKSLNNAIFLSDSSDIIKQKVFAMYTDPDHIKISDPGRVQGNAVFTYLDAFHDNKNEVAALKAHYKKGGLGDIAIKSLLNDTLQKFLAPVRQKRQQISIKEVKDILIYGGQEAKKVAAQTLQEVRQAIGINYF
jgi:tryptophanyl-tRNA synthetase